jgi:subtilisin family serine protease
MLKLKHLLITLITFGLFTACNNNKEEVKPIGADNNLNIQNVDVSKLKTGDAIPGMYIVTYNNQNTRMNLVGKDFKQRKSTVRSYTANILKQDFNVPTKNIYKAYGTAIQGFSAKLTVDQVAALKKDPRIAAVEPDRILSINYKQDKKFFQAFAQSTPWGINRVGSASGAGKTAWVIDTGVDLDHPDLNVDVNRSVSFAGLYFWIWRIGDDTDPNDGNGHGTHVAGTIAAKNDGNGVVGVAYGATVVGVKVLGSGGSGSTSDIVDGVDYVAANASAGDVANLSLGGGASTALDNAVRNLGSTGVLVALAAGNESQDANNVSPARTNHQNVVTVSAMDSNDNFASFSNYGSPVDYCAPGVSVNSTWIGGGYRSISGTSMASPHVAGLLLLRGSTNLNTDGTVNGDPDGNADPIAVR